MPAQTLSLDHAASTELLESGVNRAHLAELDSMLGAIHSYFVAEQAAGYETLERNLRAWTQSHLRTEEIEATIRLARRIRQRFKVFILVGIGGSDLGGRTLHDTLDHPFHNQLAPEQRNGAPEIYFSGDTFDPKRLNGLLDLLNSRGLLADTCVDVVSKSGKTGETIAAAMVARKRMEAAGITDWRQNFIATTGQNEQSVLFEMNRKQPFFGMLPVPDGVGGRFSFASPVGLLPFAVTAPDPRKRIENAFAGYAQAHEGLSKKDSIAYQLARWWHIGEQFARKSDMVFCNYADDARLGDWFTQLYEESIQERGGGLNVIGTRGPTGNHSILNGILRGPHDKLVLMIRWLSLGKDAVVPTKTGISGELQDLEGKSMTAIQDASWHGTLDDYLANGVPTATLSVAERDERNLFFLMRTLMDAVAIKGRLQLLHVDSNMQLNTEKELTYRQDGVEGYKERTREYAKKIPPAK